METETQKPKLVLYMSRIKLDRGGYDRCGRYYGVGTPLFEVSDREDLHWEFRANSQQQAIRFVHVRYADRYALTFASRTLQKLYREFLEKTA